MAAGEFAALRGIPPEVVAATGLYLDGDLDVAEPMVRAYLLEHGDQIEAMRLLARIGIARKVFDDAELLLAAVLKLRSGLPCCAHRVRRGPHRAASGGGRPPRA